MMGRGAARPAGETCARRKHDNGPVAARLGFAAEPVVDLRALSGRILYGECLARMAVSEKILLGGGDFVPELEAAGGIGLLDAAMVDLVLDALDDDPDAVLGCNVSPLTLADGHAWRRIVRSLERRRLPAARLVLEITESAPLDEIAAAAPRLRQAKAFGCRLAIDDFGAAHATERHLRRVAVDWDIVKLDRSGLRSAGGGVAGDLALRALAAAAGRLAPTVVVEGIETVDHLAAAQAVGAAYGQGWLFGRAEAERWMRPGDALGTRLTRALLGHGAAVRRRDDAQEGYLLSRLDGLAGTARALADQGRREPVAARRSRPPSSAPLQ